MDTAQPIAPAPSARGERIAFLVDVDNTLIDNDAAKLAIDQRMRAAVGADETERFWLAYESVRREEGRVSVPLALVEYLDTLPPRTDDRAARDQHVALAEALMGVPYRDFVYPGAEDALATLRQIGRVAILTEGDPAFQATKVSRSGLGEHVEGYVFVCPDKSAYLREVGAMFPADRLVLVEDKLRNITRAREIFGRLGVAFSGIYVRQGHYATATQEEEATVELTIDRIGALAAMAPDEIVDAITTPAGPSR
ncbi:MAG TPA: HAD family hydrolase [Thermomicrobiales bacterium]|jgi:FMN phosphatase YigB (HAD superfamily)|nr:HAD family hydrolase [Thermomicrobiales bacterium]